MEPVNITLIAALALLLVWCLRWLWCCCHGRETPAPIAWFPRKTGDGRIQRRAEED